jgi:hypothetical protein
MTEPTTIQSEAAEPDRSAVPRRRRGARPLVESLIVVAVLAVAGAFCGWLWERLWTPPTGAAYKGQWYPDAAGSQHMFDGTGSYVVIAAVAGLVLGLLAAWLFTASEIATVLALLVGGAVAGWLMHVVGLHLAPADPTARAKEAADFTPLTGTLRTYGDSYRVAFPGAALIGPTLIFLCFPGRRKPTRVEAANQPGS